MSAPAARQQAAVGLEIGSRLHRIALNESEISASRDGHTQRGCAGGCEPGFADLP